VYKNVINKIYNKISRKFNFLFNKKLDKLLILVFRTILFKFRCLFQKEQELVTYITLSNYLMRAARVACQGIRVNCDGEEIYTFPG